MTERSARRDFRALLAPGAAVTVPGRAVIVLRAAASAGA